MSKRNPTNNKIDHYIYSHTAGSKKVINIEPSMMRGGERM